MSRGDFWDGRKMKDRASLVLLLAHTGQSFNLHKPLCMLMHGLTALMVLYLLVNHVAVNFLLKGMQRYA